jgi:hypothetical protein
MQIDTSVTLRTTALLQPSRVMLYDAIVSKAALPFVETLVSTPGRLLTMCGFSY